MHEGEFYQNYFGLSQPDRRSLDTKTDKQLFHQLLYQVNIIYRKQLTVEVSYWLEGGLFAQ